MAINLGQVDQFLRPWKVRSIEILPDRHGAEVIFSGDGGDPVRLRTGEFGVGRNKAKAAALAKFAARAGFGEAHELFRYLVGLPGDTVGVLFKNVETAQPADIGKPKLRCIRADESAA